MPAVYLLRHGQASFGGPDYDLLSATGRLQAKVLGAELRRRAVVVHSVRSGTLRRQRDTAAECLAAAGIGVPCHPDPRWDEYDHLGLVPDGQPTLDTVGDPVAAGAAFQRRLEDALLRWMDGGDATGGDGTWEEFRGRCVAALEDVVAGLSRGGVALVFTSAGVISTLCAASLGMSAEGLLMLNRTLANASITKLVHGRSGTSVLSINEHGHFEGEHRELLSYR